MILFDATHTSHTSAQTGIQRVCRSLFAELEKSRPVTGVCYDPYLKAWRTLEAGELGQLRSVGRRTANSRGSLWSLRQRLAGRSRRWLGVQPKLPAATGLICPEISPPGTAARLPEIFARVNGPRIALFHDAIPLQYPELTPPGTVARFPAYLQELLQFDGVAAVSETSATVLRDYWRWLGVSRPPPVMAHPLAFTPRNLPRAEMPAASPARLLCVSTIEGRKNHLALLEACESLWQEGLKFELQLLGLARPDTARRALEKIAGLKQAGRPLLYAGVVTDAEIDLAYRQCTFTVFPSLIEGFGLPVLESLGAGKPCICSAHGALGESARGGGCVPLDTVDAAGLAAAIRNLLLHPDELAALTTAARQRELKSWPTYAGELHAWMQTLRRRG